MKSDAPRHRATFWAIVIAALIAPSFFGNMCQADNPAEEAARLLRTAGVKGGLVAHVGCDDGRLTAALRADDGFVVHGLARDEVDLAKARRYLKQRGLYGKVAVARWSGERLPYAGGVLDLLVVEDPAQVSGDEGMRVLAPGGVLLIRAEGGWKKQVKPRPEAMDDWTHYLHGPNNNAVSEDELVAPPQSTRWVTSFRHLRHHNYLASTSAMVSAGGRLFSIEDKGARMSIDLPPEWRLIARGAFNGVVLWEKPIESWANARRGFRSGPLEVNRRLVATEDRVFVTLSYDGPVVALDAGTGESVRTYEGTEGVDEILLDDGTLYLTLSVMKPRGRIDRRRLMAVDVRSGETLWENATDAVANTVAQTLTVGEERLFLHNDSAVGASSDFSHPTPP